MNDLANLAPALGGLAAALIGFLYARRVRDRAHQARTPDEPYRG